MRHLLDFLADQFAALRRLEQAYEKEADEALGQRAPTGREAGPTA